VEEIVYDNQAALKRLEEEDSWLTTAYSAAGSVVAATVFVPEPMTKLGGFLTGMVGFASQRVGIMGVEELRALMGHEKIQTTLRYSKVTSQRAKEVALYAFKKIPPFGQ